MTKPGLLAALPSFLKMKNSHSNVDADARFRPHRLASARRRRRRRRRRRAGPTLGFVVQCGVDGPPLICAVAEPGTRPHPPAPARARAAPLARFLSSLITPAGERLARRAKRAPPLLERALCSCHEKEASLPNTHRHSPPHAHVSSFALRRSPRLPRRCRRRRSPPRGGAQSSLSSRSRRPAGAQPSGKDRSSGRSMSAMPPSLAMSPADALPPPPVGLRGAARLAGEPERREADAEARRLFRLHAGSGRR